MNAIVKTAFAVILASGLAACSSTPKYDKISAKYISCDAKDMKPVEITNHGWYRSWYVACGGQEYFCRYSDKNEHGWNGCRATAQADID